MSDARRSARLGRHGLAVGFVGLLCCTAAPPSADLGTVEGGAPGDGTADLPPPNAVDFVVQGCRRSTDVVCEGEAPLVLSFAAVTTGGDVEGTWDFGDGSPVASGAVVTHVYGRAGSYDVTLTVATAAGTVGEEKVGFVAVSGAGPGGACVDAAGCASGSCICLQDCPFPLRGELCLPDACQAVGTCAIRCDELSCPGGSVCANLGLGGEVEAPWRAELCLAGCAGAQDCRRLGFSCLPVPVAAGWQRACAPPVLGEVGSPCRADTGAPDGARCLGGSCLDIGAAGYCSATCGDRPCPEGASCAQFTGGETVGVQGAVCLQRCVDGACAGDPQLACEADHGAGALGFEIIGPADPPGTTYCAPKRCDQPEECGLSGWCDGAMGGFCRPLR